MPAIPAGGLRLLATDVELERVVLAAVGGHGVLDGPTIGLTSHGVEQEQRVPHLDVKQRRRGGVRLDDVQARCARVTGWPSSVMAPYMRSVVKS